MSTLLLVLLVPRFLPPTYVPLGLGLHKSMEMASSAMSQTLAGVWLDHGRAAVMPGGAARGGEGGSEGGEGGAGEQGAVKGLLRAWLMINVLQLGCVYVLWRFERERRVQANGVTGDDASKKRDEAEEYERLPLNDLPVLDSSDDDSDYEDVQRAKAKDVASRPGFTNTRTDLAAGRGVEGIPHRDQAEQDEMLRHAPSSALARTDAERGRSKVFLLASLGWIGLVWVVFLVDAYLDLF